MNILAVDTSTKNYSLALGDGKKVLARRHVRLKELLSDSMMPGIERVLFLSKLTPADLDGFAVGLGPGSFTSLRVGISTVKALAWGLSKPVVGIPSLDAIAAGANPRRGEQICVISDARRNLVYAKFYQMKGASLDTSDDCVLLSPAALLKGNRLNTHFIGDGIKIFQEDIKDLAQKGGWKASFAPESAWFPEAAMLLSLAAPKWEAKEFIPPQHLVPLYLYPEDCQVSVR